MKLIKRNSDVIMHHDDLTNLYCFKIFQYLWVALIKKKRMIC